MEIIKQKIQRRQELSLEWHEESTRRIAPAAKILQPNLIKFYSMSSLAMVGGELYQYYPLGKYVVRAIGVCGGRPTFKYTRIEMTGTLERLAAGEGLDEIVDSYRGRVSREAIIEAVNLVNKQFINTLPELEPVL